MTRVESSSSSTDRIEKRIVLKAPRSRVWRALTDHREFGTWFQAVLETPFIEGQPIRGRITVPGYEHLAFDATVVRLEPERFFSMRWQPGGDPQPGEPRTLVEFTLEEVPGGTRLTVVETGFDQFSPERRAKVFRDNDGGWAEQLENIARHVGR